MSAVLQNLVNQPYKHGFVTDNEADFAPKGLIKACPAVTWNCLAMMVSTSSP